MSRDFHLGDDRIGELDEDALAAFLTSLMGDTTGRHEFPGDPINPLNHGFEPADGGCLAEFIADRAEECRPFVLPRGTYRWTRPLFFTDGSDQYHEPIPERFELTGAPGATIEVHIPPDLNPKLRTLFRFGGRTSPVPHVELHNLHVDVGDADPDRDAGICRASVGSMEASNLSMSRRCRLNDDGSRNGDRFSYKVDVASPSGVATHRNIDLTAGDVHVPSANAVGHAIPFASEPNHVGVNRWLGCRVAGYTDNGFYVRNYSESGQNILEGCLSRNCGGGNIRIGRNDSVRRCKVVVDGSEEPADGTALWVENAKATTVDGVEIEAPAMDNDLVRVTGDIAGASIRDLDAELGATGEYAAKLRGGYPGGHLECANWTVRDGCTGGTRLASYSIDQPNVTFRGLDHHGHGGRIPFEFREEGARVENSTVTLTDTLLARLGQRGGPSRIVDVSFDDVTVIDAGDGSQRRAFGIYADPDLRRLAISGGDWSRNGYGRLFDDTMLDDFEVASIEDVLGW